MATVIAVCVSEQKGKAKHNEPLCIIFDEPQCAVTPGQPAVLYGGDQVSGDDVNEIIGIDLPTTFVV